MAGDDLYCGLVAAILWDAIEVAHLPPGSKEYYRANRRALYLGFSSAEAEARAFASSEWCAELCHYINIDVKIYRGLFEE